MREIFTSGRDDESTYLEHIIGKHRLPTVKVCPECGNEFEEFGKVCPSCGCKLESVEDPLKTVLFPGISDFFLDVDGGKVFMTDEHGKKVAKLRIAGGEK